ncbi:PEP-utilizing enzyme [Patescibacteria group bacterium]
MFKNPIKRWEDIDKPAYQKLVKDTESKKLSDTSAVELLKDVKKLSEAAVDAYGSIVSGIIPGAWISEGLFTLAYNKLIKRKKDPRAAVFLMGYNTTPIKAEKALYDLAGWIKTQPALADYFKKTSTKKLATLFKYSITPKDIPKKTWQKWKKDFKDYLNNYGHLIYSLDFSNPTPADNPTDILETCKMYVSGKGADPHQRQRKSEEKRNLAVQKTKKRLRGLKARIFKKILQSAQKYAPSREDGLADVGLSYPLLRKMLQEIGRRLTTNDSLEEPEDVFWLVQAELETAVKKLDKQQKPQNYSPKVDQRKKAWHEAEKLTPPKMLVWGISKKESLKKVVSKAAVIKGVAGSMGVASAPAVIINGPEDFEKMKAGSILVAPLTTPAWTSLFARAAAIVTDVGGALSHGSIVAREYNIPAVLGTKNATRIIKDGQQITVDGTNGKVLLS